MTAPSIAVVDSGSGNLRSVERALERVGGAPRLTSDPDAVRRADLVVVPGQGAFADCMAAMRQRGLDQAIGEVVRAGRPYLGICLGLQILFDESEEHGPVAGLGILPGRVVRFRANQIGGLKVPHIGWNQVRPGGPDGASAGAAEAGGTGARGEPLLAGIPDGAHFYFIHSYCAEPADPALVALRCDYGGAFCAAVRRDNLFACQFHPEKSQAMGLRLLANFVGGRMRA
ncbi:MAG TPA: imidazole glycerol phosphate synthase subunit HisH [Kofleriaceae bacterium]|nr:imidazole glycerol phosphate synthase subunit HisH [Kofleriaceae bacterium]